MEVVRILQDGTSEKVGVSRRSVTVFTTVVSFFLWLSGALEALRSIDSRSDVRVDPLYAFRAAI
jgi:hypothetical protein